MEPSKRTFIMVLLAWLTSISLLSLIAASYYLELCKEKQVSEKYENMYNELVENYTDLLNSYQNLIQKYKSEKQNLTELLEQYQGCVMRVNICIDYGEWNGTVVWYNNTIVPLGCNLLEATKKVAIVNSTYWPAYQASFVDAINGVWNQGAYYWMWYRWDNEKNLWVYGDCGADRYTLTNNEILMWRYEIPSYP
ncbi:hypothetical protein J7L49_03290 [Candidatus Bathyarchaeota archaeon]|nr:hypothetical protein [Candidatus Bathyarchaeota archaeon]